MILGLVDESQNILLTVPYEISILESKFLTPKTHISETRRNWKKLKKYDPPKIEK